MHYSVKFCGMSIDEITASNDSEAKAIADSRWEHYEDLVCVCDNNRSLGGKPEAQ